MTLIHTPNSKGGKDFMGIGSQALQGPTNTAVPNAQLPYTPTGPLDYFAMRDALGLRGDQPALSSDPTISRLALTPGATFRPGEFESLMELARQAMAQQQQRGSIDQFYHDPARQAEIEKRVAPAEQSAWLNLLDQIRGTSRQAAFQRADTGNIGGSVEASQKAKIAGGAAQAGAGLADQFQTQRDMLQRALEAARVNEILKTYDIDPQLAASLQQRTQSFGVQGDTNALLEALRQRTAAMHDTQADETSRAIGSAINVGTRAYQTYNQAGQAEDYQNFLNQMRSGSGQAPAAIAPAGYGAPGVRA
jgi:hypothetical protein